MSLALINCKEIAAGLLAQREFFDFHREHEDDLPESLAKRPDLSAARYSGQRSDDESINLRVGALRMLGMSDRAIERECGIDRRTIPHRLGWLERSGRIPAVKDRVLLHTANAAERSGIVLGALLDRAHTEVSADLAGMIKAVAVAHGVTVEKLQLLTGAATEIIEHKPGVGRAETEAWAKANGLPLDCESTVLPNKCPISEGVALNTSGSDTTARPFGGLATITLTPPIGGHALTEGAGGGSAIGQPTNKEMDQHR
jgi:hypothetical protein